MRRWWSFRKADFTGHIHGLAYLMIHSAIMHLIQIKAAENGVYRYRSADTRLSWVQSCLPDFPWEVDEFILTMSAVDPV